MFTARTRWLASPWFFLAVALLFLNDHVFKESWPGLVTGKLSDFAGVVIVATVIAVPLGRLAGTVAAGLAFVALKTVPGVAEWAAPLMGGGVTVRDPSDLIALSALVPLWFALAHRPLDRRRRTRGWAAIGFAAAVLATTADTTPVPSQVDHVWFSHGTFFAQVDRYSVPFASQDGGRTWEHIETFPAPVMQPERDEVNGVCTADHICYRKAIGSSSGDDRSWNVIERSTDGVRWLEDYRFATGDWARELAVDPNDGSRVVVAHDGFVTHRTSSGAWESANLVDAAGSAVGTTVVADIPRWQWGAVKALGVPTTAVGLGVLAALAIWFAVPWRGVAAVLELGNVIVCGFLFEGALISSPQLTVRMDAVWLALVCLFAGLLRLAWWHDRRSRQVATATEQLHEKEYR